MILVSKKILCINSGSSSLKFKLYDMPEENVLISGQFERIGEELTDYQFGKSSIKIPVSNHEQAIHFLLNDLLAQEIIDSFSEIKAVGHRVAHGGELFKQSSVIDEQSLAAIESLSSLAPLHNPVAVTGIKIFRELLPGTPQVAVFDTAFHQTVAKDKFLYPLPYALYQKYGIRKYGFHGTSHKYIASRTALELGMRTENVNLISCHLGNGASICCIRNGKSIDTSMGFTPNSGLMMGTRCGDIDANIVPYLQQQCGLNCEEIDQVLGNESGLLGVSGVSKDFRDVFQSAQAGDEQARTALKMYIDRIAQYILQYFSELDRVDAVVFTAGVGEHSNYIRAKVCEKLKLIGLKLNQRDNNNARMFVNAQDSICPIMVIPTNEEVMIARDTFTLVTAKTLV